MTPPWLLITVGAAALLLGWLLLVWAWRIPPTPGQCAAPDCHRRTRPGRGRWCCTHCYQRTRPARTAPAPDLDTPRRHAPACDGAQPHRSPR